MALLLTFTVLVACKILNVNSNLDLISTTTLASGASLAKCVGEVTDRFFKNYEVSLVSLSINKPNENVVIVLENLLLSELFSRGNLSVIIKKTTEINLDENYLKSIDNYIIHIRYSSEITAILKNLESLPTWNSHAKFVVISADLFPNSKEVATLILNTLWEYKVSKGVALLPDIRNNTVFKVYSFITFSQEYCKTGINKIKIIDKCSYSYFLRGINWFYTKSDHNYNGCTFKVRAAIWPPYVLPSGKKMNISNKSLANISSGLEPMILSTMAKAANFSINYTAVNKSDEWGTIFGNGTATGIFSTLKNKETDIVIGSFAVTIERITHFDYVFYNMPESMTWCVPHAKETDQWKKLLMVIPISIWCLFFAICVIISFCIWLIHFQEPYESTSYHHISSCAQNIYSVMVNVAVKKQPLTWKVRLIFILWALVAIHITVAYESSLISVLTKPKYTQQIKTINDIFNNNLKIYLLPNALRYFQDEEDEINREILKRYQVCRDIEKCLNETAFERNSATATPRLYINYALHHYVRKNGKPLLYCFKDSLVTYSLEMMLVKGFPIQTYFRTLVTRITSAGLLAYWEKRIFELQSRTEASKTVDLEKPLNMAHLELLFIILIVGHVIASVVFLFEIYFGSRLKSYYIP